LIETTNKKVWQAVRTGNSPTKLATLRQKDRQITVHITTQEYWLNLRFSNSIPQTRVRMC